MVSVNDWLECYEAAVRCPAHGPSCTGCAVRDRLEEEVFSRLVDVIHAKERGGQEVLKGGDMPLKIDGREVVGEKCTCGHLRSEHAAQVVTPWVLVNNHGKCRRCSCEQYTWKRFVLKGEPPEKTK